MERSTVMETRETKLEKLSILLGSRSKEYQILKKRPVENAFSFDLHF